MERFTVWTGGSYVNISCKDCDYRERWAGITGLPILVETAEAHDCMRDGS